MGMDLQDLQKNWDRMGSEDPLWAIMTDPRYKGGKWDPDAFFESGRTQITAVMEHAESLGQFPRGAAFDFGCGVGRLTQALAEQFDTVTGVDIAPSMIAEARARNQHGDKVSYVLNERGDLSSFADESFDFIYTEITLMHMEPRYSTEYIAEFFRIGRPGGLVVFQVVDPTPRQKMRDRIPRSLVYFGNRLRTIRSPMMEIYGVTRQAIEDIVLRADGQVIEMQEWDHEDRTERRYWALVG
jgi:ubiquinone/menaquinone biosynthesis C-methylase UbiE